MWNNIDHVKKSVKRATLFAAILAFLSGISALLTPIDPLSEVATWLTVILAFLAAFAAVMALVCDNRKEKLEDAFKKTRPDVIVDIKTGQEDQQFYVVIEARNKVPFECHWRVVTRRDQIISGVLLDWVKVIPDDKYQVFVHRANIDVNSVEDNYLELRFDYRSLYASELRDAKLSGNIIKRYNLSPDRRCCIPIE